MHARVDFHLEGEKRERISSCSSALCLAGLKLEVELISWKDEHS